MNCAERPHSAICNQMGVISYGAISYRGRTDRKNCRFTGPVFKSFRGNVCIFAPIRKGMVRCVRPGPSLMGHLD